MAYGDRWLLLSGAERAIVERLSQACRRLDDPTVSTQIFTGLQTSADHIYVLKYLRAGVYLCTPKSEKKEKPIPCEVKLGDALMRPLISGPDAKRYQDPVTDMWVLCPYTFVDNEVQLIAARVMATSFPLAWKYLKSHEKFLRAREATKDAKGDPVFPFEDDTWFRLRRHRKLEKIILPKLVVASTVPAMRVCFDHVGQYALNNVRVNGILAADGINPWFLLAVLNTPITDWIFRRIAKPKDGDWFEANKQFIAPLPIPDATPEQRNHVADHARELQRLHTLRQRVLKRIARRLETLPRRREPDTWLFRDLTAPSLREANAPAGLDRAKRREWSVKTFEIDLTARLNSIADILKPGTILDATLSADGELKFTADGQVIIDRVFIDQERGQFLLAQWKTIASTFTITEMANGKRLSQALRSLTSSDDEVLIFQVVAAVVELKTCEEQIRFQEKEVNAKIFSLFGLTATEKAIMKVG